MRGVDNNGVEPRERYQPDKIENGINPHVKRSILWYLGFSCVFGVCFGWLMIIGERLWPDDPFLQERYLIGKATAFIVAAWAILGMIHVWEIITNGNLIGRILSNAMASAVFLGCLIIGGALLFIFL